MRGWFVVSWLAAAACGGSGDKVATLTATPHMVLADGRARVQLVFTYRQGDSPLAGEDVTFAAPAGIVIEPAHAITDTSGVAQATLRGTADGPITVSAAAGPDLASAEVTLTPLAPPCAGQLFGTAALDMRVVAATDFNGDGELDVVGQHVGSGAELWTELGNGDGSFHKSSQQKYDAAIAFFGSFDSDTVPDLVLLQPHRALVLRGEVKGSFGGTTGADLSFDPYRGAAGDLDGDGHLDIVAVGKDTLAVLYGQGSDAFDPPRERVVSAISPAAVFVRDLNGDGLADVVFYDSGFSRVYVMLAGPLRTLSDPVEYIVDSPRSIELADLDGDGDLDLVSATSAGVDISRGQGDGTFMPRARLLDETMPDDLAVVDVDHDGRLDVVTTHMTDLDAHLQTSDGSFGPAISSNITTGAFAAGGDIAVAGDLDGDGTQDLIVQDASATGLHATPLRGDGHGKFSNVDFRFYSDGLSYAPLAADLDGTGPLDIIDDGYASKDVLRAYRGQADLQFESSWRGDSAVLNFIAADLDRDGMLDVAGTHYGDLGTGDGLVVLHNMTGATFDAKPVALGDAMSKVGAVQAADVNGDGKADLVVPIEKQPAGELVVELGTGAGDFSDGVTLTVPGGARNVQAIDVTQDGKVDVLLVARQANQDSILLYRGVGDGTFEEPSTETTAPSDLRMDLLAAADLDGDGTVELVVHPYGDAYDHRYLSILSITRDPFLVYTGLDISSVRVADMDRDGRLVLVASTTTNTSAMLSIMRGQADGTFGEPELYPFGGDFDAADLDGDGRQEIVADNGVFVQRACP